MPSTKYVHVPKYKKRGKIQSHTVFCVQSCSLNWYIPQTSLSEWAFICLIPVLRNRSVASSIRERELIINLPAPGILMLASYSASSLLCCHGNRQKASAHHSRGMCWSYNRTGNYSMVIINTGNWEFGWNRGGKNNKRSIMRRSNGEQKNKK